MDFARHHFADARKTLLHQPPGLDGRVGPTQQESLDRRDGKLAGQHRWCQAGPPRGCLGSLVELHPAEMPLVLEHQRPVLLVQHEVIMFSRSVIRRFGNKLAPHTQVNAQPDVVGEAEEHLFAARLGVQDPLAGEFVPHPFQVDLAKDSPSLADVDGFDGMTLANFPLTAAVFDLGEFRHTCA